MLVEMGYLVRVKSIFNFVAVAFFMAASVITANAGSICSGIASVYSGGKTANGEQALAGRLTAAHKTLPFGTLVRVTHVKTGRSVVVRINDRGPFVGGRVIDLTPAGAHALGFSGLAPVNLTVVGRGAARGA
jgi:rare lipoprotein A